MAVKTPPDPGHDPHWDYTDAMASATVEPPWFRSRRFIVLIAAAVLVLVVVANNRKADRTIPPAAAKDEGSISPVGQADKVKCVEAADDCTPRLSATEEVKVDGVRYRISAARTAKSVGGKVAAGPFLILTVTAANDRPEISTLSDDVMSIESGGKVFRSDLAGTTAAQLSGDSDEKPFLLRDINPDTSTEGVVVFDVPDSVLAGEAQVRFNELGLGSTHGYLALPAVGN